MASQMPPHGTPKLDRSGGKNSLSPAEMPSQEVDDLDGSALVVAPFGALEQHSLHLSFETALIAQGAYLVYLY